jgi:WD40 repeat protein
MDTAISIDGRFDSEASLMLEPSFDIWSSPKIYPLGLHLTSPVLTTIATSKGIFFHTAEGITRILYQHSHKTKHSLTVQEIDTQHGSFEHCSRVDNTLVAFSKPNELLLWDSTKTTLSLDKTTKDLPIREILTITGDRTSDYFILTPATIIRILNNQETPWAEAANSETFISLAYRTPNVVLHKTFNNSANTIIQITDISSTTASLHPKIINLNFDIGIFNKFFSWFTGGTNIIDDIKKYPSYISKNCSFMVIGMEDGQVSFYDLCNKAIEEVLIDSNGDLGGPIGKEVGKAGKKVVLVSEASMVVKGIHRGRVVKMVCSEDERVLLTGGEDGNICVVDVEKGEVLNCYEGGFEGRIGTLELAARCVGCGFAVASDEKNNVKILTLNGIELKKTLSLLENEEISRNPPKVNCFRIIPRYCGVGVGAGAEELPSGKDSLDRKGPIDDVIVSYGEAGDICHLNWHRDEINIFNN